MSFEVFRVEVQGGTATHREAVEILQTLPNIMPDHESLSMRGSTYYLVDDGQHVIELELLDSPVRLSCRFTLCHPPSVDAVFLGLVRELMARLGMEVRICDDVRPEHSRPFSLRELADFSATISGYIDVRRTEWVAAFGAETFGATTNEVYRRIILPRCQPVIKHPFS
jgi:hypothetical protein